MHDTRDRTHLHPVPDDGGLGRTPPHDADAEQAVLGGLLLDNRLIPEVTAILDGPDFYRPAHEQIYDTIVDLAAAGTPADPVTVNDELTRRSQSNRAGGPAYLHTLITQVPTAANAGYYAEIVRDHAARRRLIQAGAKIVQLGYAATTGVADDVLVKATAELDHLRPSSTTTTAPSTWQPIDLTQIRASDRPRPTATLLTNNEGQGLLYPGSVHSVSGEPTSGKSWLALAAVSQEVAAGHPVAYIDFEDRPETLVARLDDMGANPANVDRLVRYIRPEQALNPRHVHALDQAVTGCRVTIIDGVTEAMTMHGLDLSKNPDVATWLEMLPRRIADASAAVLQIDHVVKDADNRGRYAIGGQHKLAGIVAAYSMIVAKPFAPSKGGHARVIIQKDRHGDVGTVGITATELHMAPDTTRSPTAVSWSLTASTYQPGDDGGVAAGPRYTGYMEKLSRIIEAAPGMNQGDVIRGCRGNKDNFKLSALNTLVEEGFLRFEKRGNAKVYYSLAPFREDDE